MGPLFPQLSIWTPSSRFLEAWEREVAKKSGYTNLKTNEDVHVAGVIPEVKFSARFSLNMSLCILFIEITPFRRFLVLQSNLRTLL